MAHVWDCKHHVVWIPKCRKKVLHEFAGQRESKIPEGHPIADLVHVYISIPPKCAVAQVVGPMKGERAIHIARTSGALPPVVAWAVGPHPAEEDGARWPRTADEGFVFEKGR